MYALRTYFYLYVFDVKVVIRYSTSKQPTTRIAMSSSTNPMEQPYSQIQKECLAICNCFQKFDQWLYGKPDIQVHTDHQL